MSLKLEVVFNTPVNDKKYTFKTFSHLLRTGSLPLKKKVYDNFCRDSHSPL